VNFQAFELDLDKDACGFGDVLILFGQPAVDVGIPGLPE